MPAPTSPAKLFAAAKTRGEKLAMISLYDAPSAQLACDGGADVLLVGDSMGNVVMGFDSTLPVTLLDMARATEAVCRGVKSSARPSVPVIADLPFATYSDAREAVQSAAVLMRAGAAGVKLEGAGPRSLSAIEALLESGVPVVGHLGYTPQSGFALPGVVQGRELPAARALLSQASKLQDAGCCAVVLEAVAAEAAAQVTGALRIATIGIGSGAACDGQVLVWHDLVGLSPEPALRFVKRYANLRAEALRAAQEFAREVHTGAFPATEHAWPMNAEDAAALQHEAPSA